MRPLHCQVSVTVPAPPEVVWRLAQDPDLRPRWDGRIARYQIHGAAEAGVAVTITAKVGPLRPQAFGRLLRFEPPDQSVLRVESVSSPLLAPGAGSWTFTPTADGRSTVWTSRFTLDGARLAWFVWPPLFLWVVRWDTRRAMAQFCRFVALKHNKNDLPQ